MRTLLLGTALLAAVLVACGGGEDGQEQLAQQIVDRADRLEQTQREQVTPLAAVSGPCVGCEPEVAPNSSRYEPPTCSWIDRDDREACSVDQEAWEKSPPVVVVFKSSYRIGRPLTLDHLKYQELSISQRTDYQVGDFITDTEEVVGLCYNSTGRHYLKPRYIQKCGPEEEECTSWRSRARGTLKAVCFSG